MSTTSNRLIIPPWLGPTSWKNVLTVAVISTSGEIVENLAEALIDVHTKRDFTWKIAVLRCRTLNDIIIQAQVAGEKTIDFVVLAIDTSRLLCIEWATRELECVHPDLRIRRVIAVNASGLPVNAMAVNPSDLISFCSENRIEMLNANVYNAEDANFVAFRLLKYLEVSLGLKNGIPNLNI